MLTVLFRCSDEELLRNSAAGLKARAHKAQDSEGPTLLFEYYFSILGSCRGICYDYSPH